MPGGGSDEKRSWDVYARLLRQRIVWIKGAINDSMASLVIAQLLFLEDEDPAADINLHIDSYGGVVTAALAIYDTMQDIKTDVRTVVCGQAAGMALMLAVGGTRGKRDVRAGSTLSFTPFRGQDSAENAKQAEEIERLTEKVCSLLGECIDRSAGQVAFLNERSAQFDAAAAVQAGLVDRVIPAD